VAGAERRACGHLRRPRRVAQCAVAGVRGRDLAALQGALPAQRGERCAQAARVGGARGGEVDLPAADPRAPPLRGEPHPRRAGTTLSPVAAKLRVAEHDVLALRESPCRPLALKSSGRMKMSKSSIAAWDGAGRGRPRGEERRAGMQPPPRIWALSPMNCCRWRRPRPPVSRASAAVTSWR